MMCSFSNLIIYNIVTHLKAIRNMTMTHIVYLLLLNYILYGTAQFKLDTRVYHTRVFAIDFCV